MVKAYWSDYLLSILTSSAVIKLLFKIGEHQLLKNWCPILLLTLTYKILAKILANWLQPLLPKVVDPQKTCFIKGRSIQDNFLAYRFSREQVRQTKQPAIFLKLDFVKAYDRLEDVFLIYRHHVGPWLQSLFHKSYRRITRRWASQGPLQWAIYLLLPSSMRDFLGLPTGTPDFCAIHPTAYDSTLRASDLGSFAWYSHFWGSFASLSALCG